MLQSIDDENTLTMPKHLFFEGFGEAPSLILFASSPTLMRLVELPGMETTIRSQIRSYVKA